jgi:hypothetical protein
MQKPPFVIVFNEIAHEICQFTADTKSVGSSVLHKLKIVETTTLFTEPGCLDLCVFPIELPNAPALDMLAEAVGHVGNQQRAHEDRMNNNDEEVTTVVKIMQNGRIFDKRYFAQDNSKAKGCLSQSFCERTVLNVSVDDPITLQNIYEIVNDEFKNRGEKCTAEDFHICRLTLVTDRISDAKNAEIATVCEIWQPDFTWDSTSKVVITIIPKKQIDEKIRIKGGSNQNDPKEQRAGAASYIASSAAVSLRMGEKLKGSKFDHYKDFTIDNKNTEEQIKSIILLQIHHYQFKSIKNKYAWNFQL